MFGPVENAPNLAGSCWLCRLLQRAETRQCWGKVDRSQPNPEQGQGFDTLRLRRDLPFREIEGWFSMSQVDRLHLLSANFADAPAAIRAAFAFSQDQQTDLLCRAAESDLPLVLIVGESSLDMFSTNQSHVRAFRPVLASLHERMAGLDGVSGVPVHVSRGADAARYLVHRAVPLFGVEADANEFARKAHLAAALAKACGSFDGELAELFRLVTRTIDRVRNETRISYSDVTSAELEIETFDAERIIEEELLAWQSSQPTLRASLPPPLSVTDFNPFSSDEPQSVVRLRNARVLTRLG